MSSNKPAYDEKDMVKTKGTAVNESGPGLDVVSVPETPEGTFEGMKAVTARDVRGTSPRGDNVKPVE